MVQLLCELELLNKVAGTSTVTHGMIASRFTSKNHFSRHFIHHFRNWFQNNVRNSFSCLGKHLLQQHAQCRQWIALFDLPTEPLPKETSIVEILTGLRGAQHRGPDGYTHADGGHIPYMSKIVGNRISSLT
jgi:hypothetical protein